MYYTAWRQEPTNRFTFNYLRINNTVNGRAHTDPLSLFADFLLRFLLACVSSRLLSGDV